MPTLDNTGLSLSIAAVLNNQQDLVKASAPLTWARSRAYGNGTGASQADKIFTDTRTIAASGNDDLDLAGVLVDPIGAVLTFARVKLIAIAAATGNTNNVVVGGGTNPVTTIMGGTTPTTIIRPGGIWLIAATDATAYAVTAATADIFRVSNSGAGTSVDYDIIIIGASA